MVGLVIALHDTLAGNIRRAAEAMDRNDIQGRCDQLIHGFKVLQQLEAMLDLESGGETAAKIQRFYTHVRGQLLLAQFKLSSAMLYKQIEIVLDVREAWQQLDSAATEDRSVTAPKYGVAHTTTEACLPGGSSALLLVLNLGRR